MEGAYHLARRGSNKVLLLHGWSRLGNYTRVRTHTQYMKTACSGYYLALLASRYELHKLRVALFNIHYLYNFACFSLMLCIPGAVPMAVHVSPGELMRSPSMSRSWTKPSSFWSRFKRRVEQIFIRKPLQGLIQLREGLYHLATGEGMQCSGEERRKALIQSAQRVEKYFLPSFSSCLDGLS